MVSGDTEDYAAVVLDLGLPRLDGLSVLRRWRSAGRTFPVLILTARGDWTEKVEGIDAGADDYMVGCVYVVYVSNFDWNEGSCLLTFYELADAQRFALLFLGLDQVECEALVAHMEAPTHSAEPRS